MIVPGINDTKEGIDEYVKFVGARMKGVEKYELLAFHTLGFSKYEKLGWENPLKDTPALTQEKLAQLQAYLDARIESK